MSKAKLKIPDLEILKASAIAHLKACNVNMEARLLSTCKLQVGSSDVLGASPVFGCNVVRQVKVGFADENRRFIGSLNDVSWICPLT